MTPHPHPQTALPNLIRNVFGRNCDITGARLCATGWAAVNELAEGENEE